LLINKSIHRLLIPEVQPIDLRILSSEFPRIGISGSSVSENLVCRRPTFREYLLSAVRFRPFAGL
jgi:hypothetical protein